MQNEKNEIHCSFLIGGSRLSQLKQENVSRLELTAVVVVKIDKLMKKEIQVLLKKSGQRVPLF